MGQTNTLQTLRPEGFEKECRDCTVRALSLAANIKYSDVHEAFKKCGRKDKHGFHTRLQFQKVCKILNLEAKQVCRHGTINSFIAYRPIGHFFCTKRGHAFTIIDGVVHDEDNLNSHIKEAWLISKKEALKE